MSLTSLSCPVASLPVPLSLPRGPVSPSLAKSLCSNGHSCFECLMAVLPPESVKASARKIPERKARDIFPPADQGSLPCARWGNGYLCFKEMSVPSAFTACNYPLVVKRKRLTVTHAVRRWTVSVFCFLRTGNGRYSPFRRFVFAVPAIVKKQMSNLKLKELWK